MYFSELSGTYYFVLSKWTGFVGTRRENGLKLELGAYSPGDCKHTFRDFHLEENYTYQESGIDIGPQLGEYKLRIDRLGLDNLNDPYHGWVNGHQGGLRLGSKQRIMGTLTVDDNLSNHSIYPHTFPKVGLLIRRQFYWKIAAKSLDKLLRDSFTCLEWLHYEAWHDVDPQQQLCIEKDMPWPNLLLDIVGR